VWNCVGLCFVLGFGIAVLKECLVFVGSFCCFLLKGRVFKCECFCLCKRMCMCVSLRCVG